MAIRSLISPANVGHLLGDVPALLIMAATLAFLTQRGEKAAVA